MSYPLTLFLPVSYILFGAV